VRRPVRRRRQEQNRTCHIHVTSQEDTLICGFAVFADLVLRLTLTSEHPSHMVNKFLTTCTDKCLSNIRRDVPYLVAKFKICVFEYIKRGDVNKSQTWWRETVLSIQNPYMLSNVESKTAKFWHLCTVDFWAVLSAFGSDLPFWNHFCPHF
jgi:hypothetical protein